MTAKEIAIKDIQEELSKNGKCFIAYREELNPIMDSLVENYEKAQEGKRSWCLFNFSKSK